MTFLRLLKKITNIEIFDQEDTTEEWFDLERDKEIMG
jgi:hypothetical protein